jgi:UDP-2,3-diacylglucosamine pyrophosphatase LpxH
MGSTASTIRRIFVSDIHMGDERSQHQPHPYGWLSDSRRDLFERFVRTVCKGDSDGHVDEVVILGDLFDQWVCPAEYDPTEPPHADPPDGEQFTKISNYNHNVIEALKAIAGKLKYVSGNHDMLVNAGIMNGILPKLKYDPDPEGHDVYAPGDGIWAEHGHWCGIGDAPHPRSGTQPFEQTPLPMGFFFSRLSAQKALKTGTSLGFADVFEGWLKKFGDQDGKGYSEFRDQIVRARNELVNKERTGKFTPLSFVVDQCVIDSLAREFSAWIMENGFDDITHNSWCSQNGAMMERLENIAGTLPWEEVEARYKYVFADWETNHKGNVENWESVICDFGSLLPAVKLIIDKQSPDSKIVIMGHTHNACVVRSAEMEGPHSWVYINAGAWCNDVKQCTYVETVYDTGNGKHTYRLKTFGENGTTGTLKEGYVKIGGEGG